MYVKWCLKQSCNIYISAIWAIEKRLVRGSVYWLYLNGDLSQVVLCYEWGSVLGCTPGNAHRAVKYNEISTQRDMTKQTEYMNMYTWQKFDYLHI